MKKLLIKQKNFNQNNENNGIRLKQRKNLTKILE